MVRALLEPPPAIRDTTQRESELDPEAYLGYFEGLAGRPDGVFYSDRRPAVGRPRQPRYGLAARMIEHLRLVVWVQAQIALKWAGLRIGPRRPLASEAEIMVQSLQKCQPSLSLSGIKVLLVGGISGYAVIHAILQDGQRRTWAVHRPRRPLSRTDAIRTAAALSLGGRTPQTRLEFQAVHRAGLSLLRPQDFDLIMEYGLHWWSLSHLEGRMDGAYYTPEL